MEFLKKFFAEGESLTYEQLQQKITEAKLNIVNLTDGGYVSQAKHKAATDQVADLQGRLAARDTDMADLQQKLAAAQADASKLPEVQSSLTALQTKYATDQTAWQQKIAKQEYEFRVREKANGVKFSSNAAKRDFIREAMEKDFKVDGETLMGYEDFFSAYKAANPGAVVDDTPPADPKPAPAPTIVLPKNDPKAGEKAVFGFHFDGVRPRPKED